MLDWEAVDQFRRRALNPEHPVIRGTAQNDDIFFQAREACNTYYDAVPDVVIDYMNQVNAKIGTDYKPFNYYGAPDAERVIIAMGSVCECAEEVVDYLNAAGDKVGLIKVRLYRPFVAKYLLDVIPSTVKAISVLDRTKEPGSIGEPLYLDVLAALSGHSLRVHSGLHRPLRLELQGYHSCSDHRRVPQHGDRYPQEAVHHWHCGRCDPSVPGGEGKPGHHSRRNPFL